MPDNINKEDDLSLDLDDLGSDTLSFSEDIENLEHINTDEISLDDLDLDTPVEMDSVPENENKTDDIDITEDLDKFEIDNTIQDIESAETPDELHDAKIDTDIDNFDLEILDDAETKPAFEDISLQDNSGIKQELSQENASTTEDIKFDDLDLKTDLGLKDELNITEDQASDINENLSKVTLDEYGVDLKSGPVTISIFEQPNNIIGSDLDEVLKKDKNVLNLNLPADKPVEIDDDQADFLTRDFETEETSESSEKKAISDADIENLSLEILEDQALNSVSDKELITDDDIQKLDTSSIDNFDLSEDKLIEAIPDELPNKEEDTIEELKDDLLIEEIPEISLVDEDGLKSDLDLSGNHIENISGDSMTNKEDDSNRLGIEDLSEIEGDIFPTEGEMPVLDEEIKSTSITGSSDDLSDSISPLSDSASVLSGTSDNESELDLEGLDSLSADKDVLDIDNISEKNIEDQTIEEETIGLSGDELDNILNTTEIVESSSDDINASAVKEESIDTMAESETIDLSNFEADLKEIGTDEIKYENDMIEEEPPVEKINISQEEEDEIYNSLKSEMQKKSQKETELSSDLKDEVKSVLSYLDKLLDALPDDKIKEFAESETFETYKKLFDELKIKN